MANLRRCMCLILLIISLLAVLIVFKKVRLHTVQQHNAETRALIRAVQANDDVAVANSLAKGADVNTRIDGETPLFWAATGSNANLELVRLLIAHGADINIQEDGFHQTVLMRIASDSTISTQIAIVQAILDSHPNLELKDMSGDTAWRIANKNGNTEITALLKKAGAVEYSIFPPVTVHHAAYSITDLGRGQANALNNRGDVVGQAFDGRKDVDGDLLGQAFVWHQGRRQLLKPFRGPFSIANSINDRGQVVGDGAWANLGPYYNEWTRHAFLWQNGVLRDLHPRSGWAAKQKNLSSSGVAVDRNGLVALSVNLDTFLWRNGQWQDLKTHSDKAGLDTAVPVAMNNTGQIALYLQASGWEHGGVWKDGNSQVLASPDNGPVTIEGRTFHVPVNNYAYSINDKGVVVGDDDDREALSWLYGKPTALLGLYHHGEMTYEMRAEHINNHGQIVGTVSDDLYVEKPEQQAVLWQGGKVVDLNACLAANSGWMLEDARDINEIGQIVGRGTYKGKEHAFLLTPLSSH
jgi:probable HAF family extracellular repeat protein